MNILFALIKLPIGNRLPNSIRNNPISIEDTSSNIRRPITSIRYIAKKQDNICTPPTRTACSLPVRSPDPLMLKSVIAWKIIILTPLNCWVRNAKKHVKKELATRRFFKTFIVICKESILEFLGISQVVNNFFEILK